MPACKNSKFQCTENLGSVLIWLCRYQSSQPNDAGSFFEKPGVFMKHQLYMLPNLLRFNWKDNSQNLIFTKSDIRRWKNRSPCSPSKNGCLRPRKKGLISRKFDWILCICMFLKMFLFPIWSSRVCNPHKYTVSSPTSSFRRLFYSVSSLGGFFCLPFISFSILCGCLPPVLLVFNAAVCLLLF